MNAVIARIGAECEKLPAKFPAGKEFDDADPACADRPTGFEVWGSGSVATKPPMW
jgi:hypothetical protein